jgi:uncharacterized protein YbaP (TraB family)
MRCAGLLLCAWLGGLLGGPRALAQAPAAAPTPEAAVPPAAARAPERAALQPTRRPLLWRIEGEPASYLYGTIHVPDARVLALPARVERAFDSAQVFCGEVPLDAATQHKLAQGAQLPPGQTLRELVPGPLYLRADRFLRARGWSIQLFEAQKIWVLATSLGVLDYLRAMASTPPLDLMLYQRAAAAGRQLDALETVEEQLALMDSIDRAGQVSLLEQTLAELESVPPQAPGPVEKLVRAYVAGDEAELMRTALEYADPDDPLTREFLDAMIDRRNQRMAAEIDRRLRAPAGAAPRRAWFFAIGSLHLPGPEGVVALLVKRGHALERLSAP